MPFTKLVDKRRVSEITDTINIPRDLAEIIEIYCGHALFSQALVKWILHGYDFMECVVDKNRPKHPYIEIFVAPCVEFPICKVGIFKPCGCKIHIYSSTEIKEDYEKYTLIRSVEDMMILVMSESESWLSEMTDEDREANSDILKSIRELIYENARYDLCDIKKEPRKRRARIL